LNVAFGNPVDKYRTMAQQRSIGTGHNSEVDVKLEMISFPSALV
jgi:hypothetical protein